MTKAREKRRRYLLELVIPERLDEEATKHQNEAATEQNWRHVAAKHAHGHRRHSGEIKREAYGRQQRQHNADKECIQEVRVCSTQFLVLVLRL